MKKLLNILSFVALSFPLFAQEETPEIEDRKHYSEEGKSGLTRAQRKYFVTVGYGAGSANWFSKLIQSDLYDKDGSVLKSGNMDLRAKNRINPFNLEASAPVGRIRLGLGVCFEKNFLDKIVLQNGTLNNGGNSVVFDENFRVDKLYGLVEVPFKSTTEKEFSFNFMGTMGYFNYTGIQRFNFFGEAALAKMFFMGAGLLADYKIFPHTYAFVYPDLEFKYFRNNDNESPSIIIHRIFCYSISGGIRIDVSKE